MSTSRFRPFAAAHKGQIATEFKSAAKTEAIKALGASAGAGALGLVAAACSGWLFFATVAVATVIAAYSLVASARAVASAVASSRLRHEGEAERSESLRFVETLMDRPIAEKRTKRWRDAVTENRHTPSLER